MNISSSLTILQKEKPELNIKVQISISEIFDNLIDLIFEKIELLTKEKYKDFQPHYLLKEEIVFEYLKLYYSITEKVIKDELKNIDFLNFNTNEINKKYFNKEGLLKIDKTANDIFVYIWDKLFSNWIRKTDKLIQKEENKLIKKNRECNVVNVNHYITKSFIKDYWSDSEFKINLITKKSFKNKYCLYGQFGHDKNIYSNILESWFGLLEGDAKQPLKKLLNLIPMNKIEKESIVAFMIIHYLRNPKRFKPKIEELLFNSDVINDYINQNKLNKEIVIKDLYESIFNNNGLYGILTKNILDNKWILLNSENSLFILPDTVLYYEQKNDGQIIVFPISPKQCLIILNEKDTRHESLKCIANSRLLSREESIIFSKFLIDISVDKILVDKNFFNYQDEILSNIVCIEDIIKIVKYENKEFKKVISYE